MSSFRRPQALRQSQYLGCTGATLKMTAIRATNTCLQNCQLHLTRQHHRSVTKDSESATRDETQLFHCPDLSPDWKTDSVRQAVCLDLFFSAFSYVFSSSLYRSFVSQILTWISRPSYQLSFYIYETFWCFKWGNGELWSMPPQSITLWHNYFELRHFRCNRYRRMPSCSFPYLNESRNFWEMVTAKNPLSPGSFITIRRQKVGTEMDLLK